MTGVRTSRRDASITPGLSSSKTYLEVRGPITDEKSAPAVPQPLRPPRARPARRAPSDATARELSRAGRRLRLRRASADSGRRVRLQDRGPAARARAVVGRTAPTAPRRGGEFVAGSA